MKAEEVNKANQALRNRMLSLSSPGAWEKTQSLTQASVEIALKDKALVKIKTVFLIGHGTSYATAMNGECYLSRIARVYARALPAYHFLHYIRDFLIAPNETLLIGVSCSGNTASVARCLEAAAARGALTLCVSGETTGSCASAARYRIVTDAHIEYTTNVSAYTVSHLFLLLGLYRLAVALGEAGGALSRQQAKGWLDGFEETKKALSALPALFTRMGEVCGGLENACPVQNIAVLGTGPNRGTVKEGALKISEFCWMFCAEEELEDFAHGRFRELNASTPLFILSPGVETLQKTKDLLAGCDKSRVPAVVYSSGADAAMRKLSAFVVDMPPLPDEYLTPFLYVFPLWFYGYHYRNRRGGLVGEKRYGLLATDVDYASHFDAAGNRV